MDRKMKRKGAALLICAGVGLSGMLVARAALWPPPEEEIFPEGLLAAAAAAHDPMGTPVRLLIPAIGVEAVVSDVGLGKTGNMAVPRSYGEAGWYRYGPQPGEEGSAVMDGHMDNGFGLPAVFRNLSLLKRGDDMYVTTRAGEVRHFKVESVERYAVGDVPRERVFDFTGEPRLNLITCTGEWDSKNKSYDERVVVYAVYMGT